MTKGYNFSQPVNEIMNGLFSEIAVKCGLFNPNFLTNWRDIVGESLYQKCTPCSLKKDFSSGKFFLIVITKDAFFKANFTHYRQILLDSINLYFGAKFIIDVKIKIYE